MIKDLIDNRELLINLVVRDIRGRYIGSTMGVLWNVITPILQLLIYTLVFSTIMRAKLGPDDGTSSFAAFLFCGLIPWNAFAETVQRSTSTIADNSNLIKKIKFPMEILVVYLAISSFIHELIALVIFLGLLVFLGELPGSYIMLLPAVFAVQLVMTVGLSLALSALNVYIRDVAHVVGLVMMIWFFTTPVVFPLGMVPYRLRLIMEINPMTSLVTLYRQLFFLNGAFDVRAFVNLCGFALLFFAVGYAIFMKHKDEFVDLV
jgi:homopolymeric O-antigen transport system permease protein